MSWGSKAASAAFSIAFAVAFARASHAGRRSTRTASRGIVLVGRLSHGLAAGHARHDSPAALRTGIEGLAQALGRMAGRLEQPPRQREDVAGEFSPAVEGLGGRAERGVGNCPSRLGDAVDPLLLALAPFLDGFANGLAKILNRLLQSGHALTPVSGSLTGGLRARDLPEERSSGNALDLVMQVRCRTSPGVAGCLDAFASRADEQTRPGLSVDSGGGGGFEPATPIVAADPSLDAPVVESASAFFQPGRADEHRRPEIGRS